MNQGNLHEEMPPRRAENLTAKAAQGGAF